MNQRGRPPRQYRSGAEGAREGRASEVPDTREAGGTVVGVVRISRAAQDTRQPWWTARIEKDSTRKVHRADGARCCDVGCAMPRWGSGATNRTPRPSRMRSRAYQRAEAAPLTERRWSDRGFVGSRRPVLAATRGGCTSRRIPGATARASASLTCWPAPGRHRRTRKPRVPSSSARDTPHRCSCPRPRTPARTGRGPRLRGGGTASCPCSSRA